MLFNDAWSRFLQNGRKQNLPVNEFVQAAKDILLSEEWPKPQLHSVIVWRCFAQ